MDAFIYKIRNLLNNDYYIGRTVNIANRKCSHFSMLRGNKHTNEILQRAFNKYGEQNFVFEVIKSVDINDIVYIEQYYLTFFKGKYNISDSAITPIGLGDKHSEKTKKKLSELGKLRVGSKNPNYGKRMSEEDKKKQSEKQKGVRVGEKCVRFGKKHTEESKRKMSEIKRTAITKEHLDKMKQARRKKRESGLLFYKRVINTETNKIYNSIKEAADDSNINYGTFTDRLHGRSSVYIPFKLL